MYKGKDSVTTMTRSVWVVKGEVLSDHHDQVGLSSRYVQGEHTRYVQEYFSQLQDTTNVLSCHIHFPVCLWIIDPNSRAPKKSTGHGNEVLSQDTAHLIQRPCYQRGSTIIHSIKSNSITQACGTFCLRQFTFSRIQLTTVVTPTGLKAPTN